MDKPVSQKRRCPYSKKVSVLCITLMWLKRQGDLIENRHEVDTDLQMAGLQ